MIPREAYPYDTPSGAAKGFPSLARVEPEQGPFPAAPETSEDAAEFDFFGELARISADLIGRQEPLGAEFEAVLGANAWDLYESDPVPAPQWPNNDHEQDGA